MDPENVDDARDCKGPLLGHAHPERQSSRSTGFDLLKRGIGLVNALLVLILLVTLIYLLGSQRGDGRSCTVEQRPPTRSFGADRRYMSLDPRHDIVWEGYSGEFAAVIDAPVEMLRPEDLAQEGKLNGKHWGAISMFHQLHCLASIRMAMQRSQRGEDIGVDDRHDAHWPHCFDYLRNSILCAADDTIERPRLDNGTVGPTIIQGILDPRQCGNSARLFDLRERYG